MSLMHWLIVGAILILFFGKTKIPDLARALGQSARNFKKAVRGEEDIDVTDSVKKLDE